MIDKGAARALVETKLRQLPVNPYDSGWVIQDDLTIEKEFGWVFFYTSRKYLETGNPLFLPFGNSPVIVDREDGTLHAAGTAKPIEDYIAAYESSRRQRTSR
jgi:hypothetical protein